MHATFCARTYGSLTGIVWWNGADQLAALAILYVVLALILVIGNVISDSPIYYIFYLSADTFPSVDLRLLLHPPGSPPTNTNALPVHTPHCTLTFDAYLTQLKREGYLDHVDIGAGGAAQKRRRVRATQQPGGGEERRRLGVAPASGS